MRYTEILLKILFLIGGINFIVTKSVTSIWFSLFLVVSFILGLILIINKNPSYRNCNTKRDLAIRGIEGTLLIVFSLVMYLLLYA